MPTISVYLDEERYRFLLEKGKASTVAKELLEKKIDEEKEGKENE